MAIYRDNVIERVILQASRTLSRIDEAQREVQTATILALQDMNAQLEAAYMSAALSENQERYMAAIVERGIESVRQVFLPESDVQQQLTAVINDLKSATIRR
jgi:hypothetical protein